MPALMNSSLTSPNLDKSRPGDTPTSAVLSSQNPHFGVKEGLPLILDPLPTGHTYIYSFAGGPHLQRSLCVCVVCVSGGNLACQKI